MTSKLVYTGDLHTRAVHESSGTMIETDAPVDNQGKGARFSPTDLLATSLGSCMLTTMGIAARDREIDLKGATASIEKIMVSAPRRIQEVRVHIDFPKNHAVSPENREYLQRVALSCPVAKSLNQELIQTVDFDWHLE
jgi:putative redox protein